MIKHALMALFLTASSNAQEPARIRPIQIITAIPETALKTVRTATSKQSIAPWVAIGVSTAVLYHNDQSLLEDVQREGRHSGVGNEDKTKTVLQVGPYPLLRFPSDTGSALYFLGDGWTHFSIAGGLYAGGYFTGGTRPHNTALQIVHGMVVSTIFSQALKRGTGRESPSEQTEERGKWRPFPSLTAYNANTPMYDAFPSGHVMTATVTFTIINANYPEYSKYIVPLGVTWVSLLGLQMMNNGVHWASDYPLALGLGYVVAKASLGMGDPGETGDKSALERFLILPANFEGAPGFTATTSF